jgi:hypothetical protein
VIAVRVGDEDVRNSLALRGLQQRVEMNGIVRAGIDDGNFAVPDDLAARSGEGERAAIPGDDSAHQWAYLHHLAGCGGRVSLEGDVVRHRFSILLSPESPGMDGQATLPTKREGGGSCEAFVEIL